MQPTRSEGLAFSASRAVSTCSAARTATARAASASVWVSERSLGLAKQRNRLVDFVDLNSLVTFYLETPQIPLAVDPGFVESAVGRDAGALDHLVRGDFRFLERLAPPYFELFEGATTLELRLVDRPVARDRRRVDFAIRLMFSVFDTKTALDGINPIAGTITLPGVVAIDEIDAHLHPAWQKSVGEWFVERFPEMQFFVTTHSPVICRAARRGSVWLLPAPGSEERPRRILGCDLDRLIDGNILDAYGTDLFGEDVTRSERSKQKLEQLAHLNRKRLTMPLSRSEQRDLERLRAAMPSSPSTTAAVQEN